ncbi:MAG: DUF4153 domain-containing protein, partial [Rikenellaceae bacterium]|nr:DUF4153 domain-containing protein [Rikenellaceae bacterium]
MNRRIRTFFSRVAATVRSTPAESLLIVFFLVYGFLMVADLLHEDQSEAASYLWLYPFGFTLAYILNCLLPAGAVRWVYYLSPLLLAPFFRLDVESWIGEPSFLTALGLCPVAVLLCRWRKDNASFVGDAVHYARNALFAFGLAGIAHLLVMAIYYSLRYIFPALPLGDENKVMEYLAVLFYIGVMPLVFLTFDRGQHGDYAPVRIVDILVNYVLTPALLIYTVILYAYFIKITATWSLPEGGIAYMVFAFTIIAVVVKAYLPLMGKRTLEWFYGRFSLVSLPALAMFWIGVGRRIGE